MTRGTTRDQGLHDSTLDLLILVFWMDDLLFCKYTSPANVPKVPSKLMVSWKIHSFLFGAQPIFRGQNLFLFRGSASLVQSIESFSLSWCFEPIWKKNSRNGSFPQVGGKIICETYHPDFHWFCHHIPRSPFVRHEKKTALTFHEILLTESLIISCMKSSRTG